MRSSPGLASTAPPAAVAQRLSKALEDALAEPAVKDKLLAAGFTPRSSTAAEFDALTKREYERLGKVARSANMSND